MNDKHVYDSLGQLQAAVRSSRDSDLVELAALLRMVEAIDETHPRMTASDVYRCRPGLDLDESTFKVYVSQARGLLRAYGSVEAVVAKARDEQGRHGRTTLKKLYDHRPR